MRQWLTLFVLLTASLAAGQSSDILGAHDLSMSGGSRVKGRMSAACLYCHVPHSGAGRTALWGQTLSSQTYTTYASTTVQNTTVQPPLGESSSLCLSCHDGTVAIGQVTPYGPYLMSGSTTTMGTQLQNTHPFSMQLPMKDAPTLVASLVATQTTADPTHSVKLIAGNVECTSCHNPHIQSVDKQSPNFLVRDDLKGALCLACHETSPRTVNTHQNQLAGWTAGIHANAPNLVQPTAGFGGYNTVAEFACLSCHMPHNGAGAARLLRASNETDCVNCHSGGTNLSPVAPNVFAEFSKAGAHPFSSPSGTHDANENVLLNQSRHATCADCHNSHSANQVSTFPTPPAIRASQSGIAGISGADGVTVLTPAVNQFENCLRCHGSSTGKTTNPAMFGYLPVRIAASADPLNVISEFALTATSSHPVMHDRTSPFLQPSLRPFMLNVDGVTQGRPMGVRVLCSDCHNSDDNREFGGTGASGPHGSKYYHILERRYEFSQAPAPGQAISNLFPNPDLSIAGPYALCGKCHDLSQVLSNSSSFSGHLNHVQQDGFSCSTCHTAHGMGAQAATITGERMVNFDASVVAPNGATPVSYNRSTNTCTLVCHGYAH
jgi:predicted CXXCH cytochrome family protein